MLYRRLYLSQGDEMGKIYIKLDEQLKDLLEYREE